MLKPMASPIGISITLLFEIYIRMSNPHFSQIVDSGFYDDTPEIRRNFFDISVGNLQCSYIENYIPAVTFTSSWTIVWSRSSLLDAHPYTPLKVDNFRIKMKKTISERTDKPYSGATFNKMVSLARRIYYLGMDSNPRYRRESPVYSVFHLTLWPFSTFKIRLGELKAG